jgi:hypothetical protein
MLRTLLKTHRPLLFLTLGACLLGTQVALPGASALDGAPGLKEAPALNEAAAFNKYGVNTERTGSFKGIGEVVYTWSSGIEVRLLPGGTGEGTGAELLSSKVDLELGESATVSDPKGGNRLKHFKKGDLVQISGWVELRTTRKKRCFSVKPMMCKWMEDSRRHTMLGSVSPTGGRCANSAKMRVRIPRGLDYRPRITVCMLDSTGTQGVVLLSASSSWYRVKTMTADLTIRTRVGGVWRHQRVAGAIEPDMPLTFTALHPLAGRAEVRGSIGIDILDDGRGMQRVKLQRIKL